MASLKNAKSTNHGILLVFDGLDSDLSEEVIVEEMGWEVRFDGQTLRQKLLVKVLARLLAHQNASAALVFCRPTCTAHHLEYIHHGVIDISMLLALVELNAHDNDHVAGDWQTPRSILGV